MLTDRQKRQSVRLQAFARFTFYSICTSAVTSSVIGVIGLARLVF